MPHGQKLRSKPLMLRTIEETKEIFGETNEVSNSDVMMITQNVAPAATTNI